MSLSIELVADATDSKTCDSFQLTVAAGRDLWTVRKSLSDFAALDTQIKSEHGDLFVKDEALSKVLCFPGIVPGDNITTGAMFASYLRGVIAHAELVSSKAVVNFLGQSKLAKALGGDADADDRSARAELARLAVGSTVDEDENPSMPSGRVSPATATASLMADVFPDGVKSVAQVNDKPTTTTNKVEQSSPSCSRELEVLLRSAISECLDTAAAAGSGSGSAAPPCSPSAGPGPFSGRKFMLVGMAPYQANVVFPTVPLGKPESKTCDGASGTAGFKPVDETDGAAVITGFEYVAGFASVPPTPVCSPAPVRRISASAGAVDGCDGSEVCRSAACSPKSLGGAFEADVPVSSAAAASAWVPSPEYDAVWEEDENPGVRAPQNSPVAFERSDKSAAGSDGSSSSFWKGVDASALRVRLMDISSGSDFGSAACAGGAAAIAS